MSMYKRVVLSLTLAVLAGFTHADSPGLGTPVTAEEIHALDIAVTPDGHGLPAGSGTAQAGEALYAVHCLACHGEEGRGAGNDVLAGGIGSLTSDQPLKTVGSYWPYATTIYDYVRRAMPYPSPGVLTGDEVYALTAYLLFVNGIISRTEEMNADTLPAVRMPNRDNFRSVLEDAR